MEPLPEDALADLLQSSQAGDRSATDALSAHLYPQVQATVHRELAIDYRRKHAWILPLFSTGDVVQEVFISVLKSLEQDLDIRDEDSLVRYVSTLVKNRLVDAFRHHSAERRDGRKAQPLEQDLNQPHGDGPEPGPATVAALAEQMSILEDALATFPERTRLLLRMRLVDERPFEEIAVQLGWPSRSACNKAFLDAKARLLLRMRERGAAPPGVEG